VATDAHSLYLEASRHTEPCADIDAAWDYAVSADDPMMAIAFDTETTDVTWGVPQEYGGLSLAGAPIVFGISVCIPGPDRLHLCWGRLGTPMFEWLAGRLRQPGYKVAHNLRFDLRVCRAQGIEIGGPSDDTLTMGRIIWDRKKKFDLQTLAEMLCPEVSDWCTPVKKELTKLKREATAWAKYQRALHSPAAKNVKRAITADEELAADCQKTPPNYADVPDEIMGPYSMTDSFLCWLLNARLRPAIDADFAGLYDRERLVLERVIDIENQGIPFDWRLAKQEALTLRAQSAKLKDKLVVAAGGSINPNASGQVLAALKSLGVPMKRLQKKGAPSTDQQLLNRLLAVYGDEVPDEGKTFIEDLLRYRATSKIQSTYLRPLAKRAQQADGMIYCSINPTNTRTSRMSCSGPNFHNIPTGK